MSLMLNHLRGIKRHLQGCLDVVMSDWAKAMAKMYYLKCVDHTMRSLSWC